MRTQDPWSVAHEAIVVVWKLAGRPILILTVLEAEGYCTCTLGISESITGSTRESPQRASWWSDETLLKRKKVDIG